MQVAYNFISRSLCLILCVSILLTGNQLNYAEISQTDALSLLFENSIVANPNQLNHYFINGLYEAPLTTQDAPKIETVNGEKYIYHKTLLQMLEAYELHNKWQIVTDQSNTKYQLVSWKGLSQGGGWSSLNEIKTKITFTLGKTQALRDGQQMTLSHPPLKIKGRVYLPLSAIEPLFAYSSICMDTLLLIGNHESSILSKLDLSAFNKVTSFLSTPPQKRPERNTHFAFKQVDEKTLLYSTQDEDHSHLWLKKGNQPAKEIKMPESAKSWSSLHLLDQKSLYYLAFSGKDVYLFAFDTASEKHLPLANLSKLLNLMPSKTVDIALTGITSIENTQGKEILLSLHSDEVTLGDERLFKLKNKKLILLAQSKDLQSFKHFSNGLVLIEKKSSFDDLNSLVIMKDDLAQPIIIEDSKWSFHEVFLESEECYVTATPYPNTTHEKPSLFKLDLNTGEKSQLTPSQDGFWPLDKIYYLDDRTRYLKSVAFNGKSENTLIKAPIQEIKIQNNQCYYTLADGTSGVYKFDLNKRTNFKVLDAKIHQLFITKDMIGGLSKGFDPGFFFVKNNKTQQVLSGYFEDLFVFGNQIMYVNINSKALTSKYIKN